MAQPPILFTIPIELQKDILDLLPYPTLQVLHATHPHFRTLIDLDKVRGSTPQEDLIDEMVSAYRYDPFRRLKRHPPCRVCLRFRPKCQFADRVMEKKKPEKWFCIQCGIDHFYRPGTEIWSGGKPGVWCRKCEIFKRGAENLLMRGGMFCRTCREEIEMARERSREEYNKMFVLGPGELMGS